MRATTRFSRALRSIVAGGAVAGSLLLAAPGLTGTAGADPADFTFNVSADCTAQGVTYTFDITNSGPPVDVDVQKQVAGGWNLVPKPAVGVAQVVQATNLNVIVRFTAWVNDVQLYDSGEITSTGVGAGCGIAVWPTGQGLTFDLSGTCDESGVAWRVGITNANQDPVALEATWQIDQGAPTYTAFVVGASASVGPDVPFGSITNIWLQDQLGRVVYDSGELAATPSPECGRQAVHQVTATIGLQCVEGEPKIVFTVDNDGDYAELIEVTYATFDDSYSDGATVSVGAGETHHESASIPTGIQVLGEVNLKFPAQPTPPLATLDATLASCSTVEQPETPETPGSGPTLPHTGRTTAPTIALALAMIMAGSGLVVGSRRRS